MEIAFDRRADRDLAESQKALRSRFGQGGSAALMAVLSDIRATDSVVDLAGCGIVPEEFDDQCFRIRVAPDLVLAVTANHAKPPRRANGALDWGRVYMLKILEIRHET